MWQPAAQHGLVSPTLAAHSNAVTGSEAYSIWCISSATGRYCLAAATSGSHTAAWQDNRELRKFCEQTPLEQRGSTAMLLLPLQGLASGLFFLTYCIMQLPSNICCMLLGVQKWLTVIMFTWGLVAALFAAVQHPWQFYLLRLLLGLAEAGTFPGM